MKAPQIWRLERGVYDSFHEAGMSAARKRKSNSDPAVKAFLEAIPQVDDPILTLMRFEAFVTGWKLTIEFDRGDRIAARLFDKDNSDGE